MKASLKLILTLTALYFLILFISCKKIDSIQEDKLSNSNEIANKFFNTHRTSDPKEAALVNYLKNRNIKENFVEGIVNRIGYPRWDKAFQFPNKTKSNASTNLVGDSTSIYHIPFVRDSQNFVNASMILIANQTDTSISYKCDWEYSQKQNSIHSYTDSAEYFAVYFMILDKTVFGYNKFNITDSNLFKNNNHTSKYVTLNTSNSNTTNSLLQWVTTCQEVTMSWQDCPYGGINCKSNGDPGCDNCSRCTNSISYDYCSSTWQETGGGGGSGTGGSGTGGGAGGSGGGSPTPPNCNTPSTPAAKGNSPISNLTEGCGTGWNPVPVIPTSTAPASLTRVDYNLITDPCLMAVIHDIGVAGHSSYILKTYFDQNLNTNGSQKKYKIKYLTNTALVGQDGLPTAGQTNVSTLADGTKQVEITLNPTLFQNSTKEWVTTVILHELVHGIISVELPSLTTNIAQHTWMFDNKVPITIFQSLKELFPSIDDYDAIALGLDGMSQGYLIPGTNNIDPVKEAFAQQNYFQNLNQAISAASNYRNAVAGFGTAFC